MVSNQNCNIVTRCSPEERARLFAAWKKAEGIASATQFVKVAVNKLAGEEIFEVEEKKYENRIKG